MNNKKGFVLTEVILMIMVIGLALMMISGQNKKALDKVSVILENAGDSQWSALKYGLKMAAEAVGFFSYHEPAEALYFPLCGGYRAG